MRNIRRLCAGLALACALAVSTSAGDISCPGVAPPPPSAPQDATTPATDDAGVVGFALSLLQGVLSLL